MTSDDETQPELTSSGLTDPPIDPGAIGTTEVHEPIYTSATGSSTPFGPASSTSFASYVWYDAGTTNTGLIVTEALEEAAQAVIRPDILLDQVDELVAAVQGPAVKAVLEARIALIVDKGHTADSDDFLPVGWLPMEARKCFERGRDELAAEERDLAAVRALLIEGIAFGLAAIDRLDRAIAAGER